MNEKYYNVLKVLGIEVDKPFKIKGRKERFKFNSEGKLFKESDYSPAKLYTNWDEIFKCNVLYTNILTGCEEVIKPISDDIIEKLRAFKILGYNYLVKENACIIYACEILPTKQVGLGWDLDKGNFIEFDEENIPTPIDLIEEDENGDGYLCIDDYI